MDARETNCPQIDNQATRRYTNFLEKRLTNKLGGETMRRALTVFSVLLLAPVAFVIAYSYFDFDFRMGEVPPGTVNTILTFHCACALAAVVWLGVAVWRNWGHVLKDVCSMLGIICLLLATVSVLAWGYYLPQIILAGVWYDLP